MNILALALLPIALFAQTQSSGPIVLDEFASRRQNDMVSPDNTNLWTEGELGECVHVTSVSGGVDLQEAQRDRRLFRRFKGFRRIFSGFEKLDVFSWDSFHLHSPSKRCA